MCRDESALRVLFHLHFFKIYDNVTASRKIWQLNWLSIPLVGIPFSKHISFTYYYGKLTFKWQHRHNEATCVKRARDCNHLRRSLTHLSKYTRTDEKNGGIPLWYAFNILLIYQNENLGSDEKWKVEPIHWNGDFIQERECSFLIIRWVIQTFTGNPLPFFNCLTLVYQNKM